MIGGIPYGWDEHPVVDAQIEVVIENVTDDD
jgi:hypothetical protein